jgi:guanylate kinase
MKPRGQLFGISAPSGAGKTTLCRTVRQHFPDMLYSVSYTTRSPRFDEQDGVDYFFITEDEFQKKTQKGEWAEWAEVHGNFYGTSADFLNSGIAAGKDILLAIDVQGTLQIIKRYPDSITIFIMPPSMDALKNRLESRGADSEEDIRTRLLNAKDEMQKSRIYRYVVVNDHLPDAEAELLSIIKNHRIDKQSK